MPFENGSVSFRLMLLPRTFPADALSRFADHAAPPLDAVTTGVSRGWITGRHLLDSKITEETGMYGGWIRLALREAERKVPGTLLKAECRLEELAVMAAEGKPYVKAKERSEIRQSVMDRLLPDMPPQMKAIPFVYKPDEAHLYVSALSIPALDTFSNFLVTGLGFSGEAATPEALAKHLQHVDLLDFKGVSFSPEMEDVAMEAAPGREFLTWLWYKTDIQNGRIALNDGRDLAVLIEGPLTFVHEGNGAHISVLKNGMPENSAEAKTCLLSGKKLKEAKITFALDDELQWSFRLEADQFIFRNLKLPQSEDRMDPVSRFQERMNFLEQWREIFTDIYSTFVENRTKTAAWKKTCDAIREWVPTRASRK